MFHATSPTADRLFDRPWRPGHHPFGKSPSRLRRWVMVTTLLVLCSLIGAYLYYTDEFKHWVPGVSVNIAPKN